MRENGESIQSKESHVSPLTFANAYFQQSQIEDMSRLERRPQFKKDLESLPSISSWASRPENYDPWRPYPIPEFPEEAKIVEWRVIAAGRHREIRRSGEERA